MSLDSVHMGCRIRSESQAVQTDTNTNTDTNRVGRLVDVHQRSQRPGSYRNRSWSCACGSVPGPWAPTAPSRRSEPIFLRFGEIRNALAVAEQAGVIAQAAKHPAGTVWAECWVGNAHHFLGDQAAAQFHCERSLALLAELGVFNPNFFGFDQRIRVLVNLARAMWLRGFSDQALRIARSTIGEAASRNHPVSVCFSLAYASMLLLWTGDMPEASELIEQLIVHAGQYSLEPYRALGIALKGELAVAREEPEAGLDLLRSALGILRAQQYNLVIMLFTGALAEGLRKCGQFEEALVTVNGGIARATNSGMEWDLSELLRIKSQILAARHDRESAMSCLTEAIAVARTLALVYDRFTEGFETADLKLARAA
jgi:tetratricopeptide (TPR) repeat protein